MQIIGRKQSFRNPTMNQTIVTPIPKPTKKPTKPENIKKDKPKKPPFRQKLEKIKAKMPINFISGRVDQ